MQKTNKSIFRSEAFHRYVERRYAPVLLRLPVEQAFPGLWAIVALCFVAISWILPVPVTVYGKGAAIVLRRVSAKDLAGRRAVVLLAADDGVGLHIGDSVELGKNKLLARIVASEKGTWSEHKLVERYGIQQGALPEKTFPAVAAVAYITAPSGSLLHDGEIVTARVEVPSGTAMTYLVPSIAEAKRMLRNGQ